MQLENVLNIQTMIIIIIIIIIIITIIIMIIIVKSHGNVLYYISLIFKCNVIFVSCTVFLEYA